MDGYYSFYIIIIIIVNITVIHTNTSPIFMKWFIVTLFVWMIHENCSGGNKYVPTIKGIINVWFELMNHTFLTVLKPFLWKIKQYRFFFRVSSAVVEEDDDFNVILLDTLIYCNNYIYQIWLQTKPAVHLLLLISLSDANMPWLLLLLCFPRCVVKNVTGINSGCTCWGMGCIYIKELVSKINLFISGTLAVHFRIFSYVHRH